jgi:hypothetical protein
VRPQFRAEKTINAKVEIEFANTLPRSVAARVVQGDTQLPKCWNMSNWFLDTINSISPRRGTRYRVPLTY